MADTNRISRLLLTVTLLTLSTIQASAGIYTWTDQSGEVHFGDQPPIDRNADEVSVRVNTYESPPQITRTDVVATSRDKVILYTTQRCGYCRKAKQFLNRKNISYKEYDVETSKKGQRDYKKLNGRGVPIILVGDQRMDGFSEERMAAMLKSGGYDK